MRHFSLLAVSAATAVSAVLCLSPIAAAADPAAAIALRDNDHQREEAFTLVAQNTQRTNIGDGSTQGSGSVFANDLYFNSLKVGTGGGTCTIVRTGPADSGAMQCLAAFSLPKGDITAQGVISFTGSPSSFDLGITGGTEAYRDSSGWIHGSIDTATGTTTLTFHIDR